MCPPTTANIPSECYLGSLAAVGQQLLLPAGQGGQRQWQVEERREGRGEDTLLSMEGKGKGEELLPF